jgi:hypothetical protein
VLAVIEQQQRLAREEGADKGVGGRFMRRGDDTERRSQSGWHQCRISERCQVDPNDAIGEMAGHIVSDSLGEARFPDAARTGQHQDWNGLIQEDCSRGRTLGLSADEPGAGDGEGPE